MAKRPRMQAKPSRLHMVLPLTSFRQNRRRGESGIGPVLEARGFRTMSAFWKQIDREQCLKHPVISEFNAKDFGSSRAVPIFLL